jgi:hypothetical protein
VTNHDEELLTELLLQWEELYERGQDSSPEELCRDCPHLLAELRGRIAAMKATDWLNNPDCEEDAASNVTHQNANKVLNGRYRLDTLIATGGFAEVWRAFDTELQRIVAIKLPKPSRLASSTSFITEARRVARLKHPGIVPLHDVGTEESGRCFIVSEFVEGGSLADRLTQFPPPLSDTVQWLRDIAEALEYAHLHGVVHRDIKPANILIDHHGRALLADFGIAQSAQRFDVYAPTLGTLRYMSPEQLEGKAATPQSDVYSLGVLLYECLTGELPYSTSDTDLLRREILDGASNFNRTHPAALIEVCRKAVRRLPHERHSSAAHLGSEVARASAEDETHGATPGDEQSPAKGLRQKLGWIIRHGGTVALFPFLTAGMLLALSAIAWLLYSLLGQMEKVFDDFGCGLPAIYYVLRAIVFYGIPIVVAGFACFLVAVYAAGTRKPSSSLWLGACVAAMCICFLAFIVVICLLLPLVKLLQDLS